MTTIKRLMLGGSESTIIYLEKEALKATQNQLSIRLGWHDLERQWLLGQVECLRKQNRELRAGHMVISRLNLGVRP